jgi:hypothetical protein
MSKLDLNNFDISKLDINNFDMAQFNKLVNQTSDNVMCDANCQKERKSNNLKQKYLNAQTNLYTAPSQLRTAEKNYYTFTEGSSSYNAILETELQATVEEITDSKKTEIDNKAVQIQTKIDSYNGLFLNFENVYELYDKYKTRNLELLDELKDETEDVLTNERKTYYEDQGIDSLKFYYYYFLLTIYIVCVIMFVGFSLIYPSQYSIMARIFVFILLIIIPLISSNILTSWIYLCEEAYKLLPKNVYKTI